MAASRAAAKPATVKGVAIRLGTMLLARVPLQLLLMVLVRLRSITIATLLSSRSMFNVLSYLPRLICSLFGDSLAD